MTEYIIRIIANADGSPSRLAGCYVETFDVDAYGGRGELDTTAHACLAMRFASRAEAIRFWQRQSRVCPVRADGMPNRPLTAFHVDIGPAP